MADDKPTLSDIDAAPDTGPASAGGTEQDLLARVGHLSDALVALTDRYDRVTTLLGDSTRATEILNSLMRPWANRVYAFMCTYCIFVGVLLLAQMVQAPTLLRPLPPEVIEVLVGSTAVTIIGLVGTVVTSIFAGARRLDRDLGRRIRDELNAPMRPGGRR